MSEDEIDIESNMSQRCSTDQSLQINSSAIMKSHFVTLDLSRKNLHSLPTLMPKVQRLVAVENMIEQIPQAHVISNLRYIDLSSNNIETIPLGLNSLLYLDTLKLNRNLITRLVAIHPLRVYHVMSNPITVLELECGSCRMEQLGFDWLAYHDQNLNLIWQDTQLTDLKLCMLRLKREKLDVEFKEFMNMPIEKSNKQKRKNIYHAILRKHDAYFDYLSGLIGPDDVIEQYKFNDKLLLEMALSDRYQPALNLFRKQKFNKSACVDYLHLAAKYSDVDLFNTMLRKGYSIHQVNSSGNTLLHEIIANFERTKSPPILHMLLKFLRNANIKNNRKLNCLMYGATKSPLCFKEFVKFMADNRQALGNFDFDQICGINFLENVLHFSARVSDIQLANLLLGLQVMDPLVHNSLNRRARSITQHYLIRKLLIKQEKKHIFLQLNKQPAESQLNEQVIVNLPTVRQTQTLKYSQLFEFQLQLMKEYPLSEKIGKLVSILYGPKYKLGVDKKTLLKLLDIVSSVGKNEEAIKDLILSYVQRAPEHKQTISQELECSYPLKLAYQNQMESTIEMFQQYQTICLMRTNLKSIQTTTSTKILPFSFGFCAQVAVAEESTITIHPKAMKTYRQVEKEKKQQKTQSTMATTNMHEYYSKRSEKNIKNPIRRLSLTFIR